MGTQALGLQKDLVAVLAGKAVDLVFHARAITRAHPVDLAGEHGAAVKARTNDLVGALVGVGDPAGHLLRMGDVLTHEAEHRHGVALAAFHAVAGLTQAF